MIDTTTPRRRARFIRREIDPEGSELLLAFISLGWGGVLLAYPDALASFPAYASMLRVAPQSVWVVAMFLAFAASLGGVLWEATVWRVLALCFQVFIWTSVGVGILLISPNGPGWTVYLALALHASWAARRVVLRHVAYGG